MYEDWGFHGGGWMRTVVRGWKWRAGASVALLLGGLVWLVVYLAAFAVRFSWYVNVGVVAGSIVLVPAIVVAIWVRWGRAVRSRLRESFGSWSGD
jgi:hypothetical protein